MRCAARSRGGRALLALTLLGAVAAALSTPAAARAHSRSVSYSSWAIDGRGAKVELRVALLDLSALEGAIPGALPRGAAPAPELTRYLGSRLRLLDHDGRACAPVDDSFRSLHAARGWARWEWRVRCEATPARIRADVLMDELPSHVHFARLEGAGSADAAGERVLDPERRAALLPRPDAEPAGWTAAVARYVPVGVEHILGGWDHLVFLLALLLLAASWRETAVVVTGFTLGHSATLVMAALGTLKADGRAVEALIGLSIAIVAAENVWLAEGRRDARLPAAVVALVGLAALGAHLLGGIPPLALAGVGLLCACYFGLLARSERPRAWRAAVASLFGLVHGLGFASVLGEMQLGPAERVPALLGFNVGVELGQLAVVALVWPLLLLVRRRGEGAHRAAVRLGSAAAAGAGVFWVVTRAFT